MLSVDELCDESNDFRCLYECFLPYKDFTEDNVAHLPEHLQWVVLGVREIFESRFCLQLFYWLYVKSPFSFLLRPVISHLYRDVRARI